MRKLLSLIFLLVTTNSWAICTTTQYNPYSGKLDFCEEGGGGGSGTINTGVAGRVAYYTVTGTTIDDTTAITVSGNNATITGTLKVVGASLTVDGQEVCQEDGTNCPSSSEINNLETITTGIATTEIPIGTAADTVVYAALSGQATMTNGGVVTVNDVTCTNCLTTTEVASADLATLATNVSDADFGDVTVAAGAWAVEDDSHAHTSSSISGIDISADTNLTAGDALTLTDDDIDFDGGASPGGELGNTWASPTIDDGISLASLTLTGTQTFDNGFGANFEEGSGSGDNFVGLRSATTLGGNATLVLSDDIRACAAGEVLEVASVAGGSVVLECDTDGGGAGDIESVGDVVSGAAFDGTQGTTLTFNNAGGDATVDYDGTDINISKPLTVSGTAMIKNTEGLDGKLHLQADDGDDGLDRGTIELEAADGDMTFNNNVTELGKFEADGSLAVTGDGNQSTITEGLVVNNGNGTDEDDDFTVKVGGGSAVYEIDAGASTLTSTSNDAGWKIVDQTDNQACTTGCTSACLFGIENATGTAVTNLVSCDGTTADLCACMGPS